MILKLHQGLKEDGLQVSISQLCTWFGVARRSVYYRPIKAAPRVNEAYAEPIKKMIEEQPSFGYRTVAWLLGFNKNTVQRIFQLKGWQVRKRAIGMRPRIQALPSVAKAPNERWSTDLCVSAVLAPPVRLHSDLTLDIHRWMDGSFSNGAYNGVSPKWHGVSASAIVPRLML